MSEPLRLDGCTPEPLMGYLKALGVLRLLSEQRPDANVRGWWKGEAFCLPRPEFNEEAITSFFLKSYSPAPLLAPWNSGSGFYVKADLDRFFDSEGKTVVFKSRDVVSTIEAVENSGTERLRRYREEIRHVKSALVRLGRPLDIAEALATTLQIYLGKARGASEQVKKRAKKEAKAQATELLDDFLIFHAGGRPYRIERVDKDQFVALLRGTILADEGLGWIDAALTMRTGQKKNRVEAPVLGTGGNISNSEFSARFAQMLAKVMPFQPDALVPANSDKWLRASLFGYPAPELLDVSVDQFDPGRAGGANGTQGLSADPLLNPWDYILMMEGAVALSGSPTRRLAANSDGAGFPFTVDSSPVGYASAGKDKTRGEMWLPLWDRPARYDEVRFLMAEGRAEIGRRQAWSGLTFAQAVAGLGVDRGIREFVRYEFLTRLGDNTLATPLGRFGVPDAPLDGIELVRSLNNQLVEFRFACRSKDDGAKADPPARFPTVLRNIDTTVFEFCKFGRHGGAKILADILLEVGRAERELAVGDMPASKRRTSRPLGGLSPAWIAASDDGSPEYRLSRAVALIRSPIDGTVPPLRAYLEPVERLGKVWHWSGSDEAKRATRASQERSTKSVVWSAAGLPINLGAVLLRRLLDANKAGETMLPLSSPAPVSISDIALFLAGQTDDERLEELIWGMALVEPPTDELRGFLAAHAVEAEPLPRVYALLKLTVLPGRIGWVRRGNAVILRHTRIDAEGCVAVRPESAMLARLRAGDVSGACEVAIRRLRSAGLVPLPGIRADGSWRDVTDEFAAPADRLLAALLFPITDTAVNTLGQMALRRPAADALA